MPRNNMDLLASILDEETAKRTTPGESADLMVVDANKSNKKQKVYSDSDSNKVNVAGTGGNTGIDAKTGTAGAVNPGADASAARSSFGINTCSDGGRGADGKMDVIMETPAQTADSRTSEGAPIKTPKIIHPKTTTESVVKDFIASPVYQQLLEEKEQTRLSAKQVVKQVVHRPPIPDINLPSRTATETTVSQDAVTETTAALPSNPDSEPRTQVSSASKSEINPISPSRSKAMSTATATATAPTPIPTGRARTSEYINRLYHLCNAEGLDAPIFEFDIVAFAPASLFKATLTIAGLIVGSDGVESASPIGEKKGGGVGLVTATASSSGTADGGIDPVKAGEKGAFKSKKEAKEAAAEYGYLALTRFVNEGIIGRKAGSRAGLGKEGQKQSEGPKENWIGLLQEFCSKTGTRNPVSQEYVLGTRFACETYISQRNKGSNSNGNASVNATGDPDPSIDGIPFGGCDKVFPSKKAARQNAACEAIAWLKENGYYSTATGKPVARPDNFGNGGNSESADDGVGEETRFVGMKKGMSYGQMIAEYCHILVLPQPEYRFENTPNAPPGFLSGAAFFLDHPEFDGPVGEIRNIYGKKAAKQECARRVAEVLSDMLAEERGLK